MTESWPVYGYDPGHTGHGTGVTAPDGPVEERWVHDLGGKFAYRQPVVGASGWPGHVYVHGLMTQVTAPNVRAVGCDDGALRWAVDTGLEYGYQSGSPVVTDDRVVLPGGWLVEATSGGRLWATPEPERRPMTVDRGLVHQGFSALDLETGEQQWVAEFETPVFTGVTPDGEEQVLQRGPVGHAPAVADGTVFVSGRIQEGMVRARDGGEVQDDYEEWGHVHALDATEGTVQWGTEFETPAPISTATVTDGETVYVADQDATLRAFDAEDGRERWRAGTGAELVTRPAVANGRVFVRGRSNQLRALDAADGSVEWRLDLDGSIVGAPAVVDEVVYLALKDGAVVAADVKDGTVRWQFGVDDRLGAGVDALYGSGPVVSDGRIYVAGYALHCLEPRS